jgi:hypothetical protein
MRYFITLFLLFILAVEISFPVGAATTPEIDKIEALLQKIEANLKQASAVISVAKKTSEKMVQAKVQEKEELKEAVIVAEAKVEKMEEIQEVFVAKMVAAGVDTTMMVVDEGKNAGPIFDAFLEYQKNGGTEDFEYFRLYIYK